MRNAECGMRIGVGRGQGGGAVRSVRASGVGGKVIERVGSGCQGEVGVGRMRGVRGVRGVMERASKMWVGSELSLLVAGV